MRTAVFVMIFVFSASAMAAKAKPRKLFLKAKDIELTCGVSSKRNEFSYLAEIRNYSGSKGGTYQVATIYKGKRPVLRSLVHLFQDGEKTIYRSLTQNFSLDIANFNDATGLGDFKAVIRQKDGDTYIANSQFPCHKAAKSQS